MAMRPRCSFGSGWAAGAGEGSNGCSGGRAAGRLGVEGGGAVERWAAERAEAALLFIVQHGSDGWLAGAQPTRRTHRWTAAPLYRSTAAPLHRCTAEPPCTAGPPCTCPY
jgi:hypothetical protein